MSVVSNLIRKSVKHDGPLNILTFFYDGRFDVELLKTGHNFYGSLEQSCYKWPGFAAANYPNLFVINQTTDLSTIDFDLALFNSREAHAGFFQTARHLHIPSLIVDHDYSFSNKFFLKQEVASTPFMSVACSDVTQEQFGSSEKVYYGLEHTVGQYEKDIDVLVSGSFRDEDIFIIDRLHKAFPSLKLIGHNPRLPYSEILPSFEDYKNIFKRTKVFLNIAPQKNLGYEILWALQHKCIIVSNRMPFYNELLEDGVNYIGTSSIDEMIPAINKLVANRTLLSNMLNHQTNLDRFNQENFIGRWNEIFEQYRHKVYMI